MVAGSVENDGKRDEFGNDLHVFAAAGYAGAHLDRVGGSTYYHSPRDSLAHLDPAALQRQGEAMLALARHFGDLPIGESRADDAVFFSLLGLPILSYPVTWALPLALLALLALAGAVGLGLRRGRLAARRTAVALVAVVAGAALAAGAGHLLWRPILASHLESGAFAERDFYGQDLYVGGLYVLVVAVALAALPWLSGRLGRGNVAVAGVAPLVLVGLVQSAVQPLASYLAVWPALSGALGLLVVGALPGRGGAWGWARVLVPLVAAIPAIGLLAATLFQSTIDGVGDDPALLFAVLALLLGALAPLLERIARLARRAVPAAVALAGVGLLAAGGLTSGYSADQPRPDTLAYVLDADADVARWVSADPAPDEWTEQLLAGAAPATTDELFGDGGTDTLWASRAPPAALPPPRLELVAAETNGDTTTLRLRLTSPRGASRVYLVPRDGAELLAAGLGGATPEPVTGGELRIAGLPADGLELTLRLRAAGPIRLNVIDESTGLPELPGLPARPVTVMSAPNPAALRGYPTAVRTSVEFARPG
jgi:hypothetical protein